MAVEKKKLLEAVSNVIELKPGHKYLLILKGNDIPREFGDKVTVRLREMGIENIVFTIGDNEEVEVIEVEEEKKQS